MTLALSVVIPCYNEAGNVPLLAAALIQALAPRGEPFEIIFVDDGSTDATAAEVRAERAKDERVRLVALARNFGLTTAMEAGLRRARGAVLVVMDGDFQQDPAEIPRLLEPLSDHDCVCGYRLGRRAGDGFFKAACSRIANFVRNRLAGDHVTDTGCTFRAFKRECIERVKFFRGMHRFLPTLIRFEGFRVTEVPVSHRARRHGVSKFGLWNRVFVTAFDLVALRWMRSRVVRVEVREET